LVRVIPDISNIPYACEGVKGRGRDFAVTIKKAVMSIALTTAMFEKRLFYALHSTIQ
jgi:hypothetical protein